MPVISTEQHLARIHALQQHLCAKAIDIAILNNNADLAYYAGSIQPLYLLIPAVGTPVVVARKALTRLQQEVTHLPVEEFSGTRELAVILLRYHLIPAHRVAFTLDTTAYATVTRMRQLFEDATEIVDISWEIRLLRMVKSMEEIAIQTQAGKYMMAVPNIVRSTFIPGMTELALSAALEYDFRLHEHTSLIRCRREGVEMTGFGVCSAGVNSLAGTKFDGICAGIGLAPAAPYGASNNVIPPATPIVLDFAYSLAGYHMDQTRMCSWGEPSHEVLHAYQAMIEIEHACFAALQPGVLWEDIYTLAISMAAKMGYADTFMGAGTERVKFVGHGVGLELDEPPYLAPQMRYPLAAGMVIALEPKVALPGIGVVGIEDTIVLKEEGYDLLTLCSNDFIII